MGFRRTSCIIMVSAVIGLGPMARGARIELTTGDVLFGRVVSQTNQQVVVEHPVMGRLSFSADTVKRVTEDAAPGSGDKGALPAPGSTSDTSGGDKGALPAPGSTSDTSGGGTTLPAPASASDTSGGGADILPVDRPATADEGAGAASTPPQRTWLDEWDIQWSIGFAGRDSNSDTLDFNTRLDANYADDQDRWRLRAEYFLVTQEGQRIRDDLRLSARKDWLLPESPWFLFGQGEYERDDFKSWEHRLSGHGGMGYDLKPLLNLDAQLRAGAGVTREFGGTDPKFRPESLLSSEMALKLSERHSVAASVSYFPSVDRTDEYRLVTTTDWTIKLTEGLGLRLGLRDEYDSAVPEDFQKNDLRIYGSLVFDF